MKLVLAFLLSLCFVSNCAVEAHVRHPTNPRFIERGLGLQKRQPQLIPQKADFKNGLQTGLKAAPSHASDSDFHGWWKLESFGGKFGFGAFTEAVATSFGPVICDQYIYIDTTVNPPQVFTTYGTDLYPRSQDPLDPSLPAFEPPLAGDPAPNAYAFQGPSKLVSLFNPPLCGSVPPQLSLGPVAPTLELIDKETLSAHWFSNPHYVSNAFFNSPSVYKKMKRPPVDTLNYNWNDPVLEFKYYANMSTFQNPSVNKQSGGKNYVGDKKAKKIMKQFLGQDDLGQGYTVKTPIRKIRITNFANYAAIGITDDAWTTIYTGDPETDEGIFSNVTIGSSPTITGAKGPLAVLNGHYYNGVSVLNNAANHTLDKHYVDKGPHGSFNDLFNSFLLNLDTSSLASLTDPATGFIDVPPGVFVEVTYKVHSAMEYPEFVSACAAYFNAVVRAGTHTARSPFTYPNSSQLINTFAELQIALLDETVNQNYSDRMRTGQGNPNDLYHNSVDLLRFFGDYLYRTLVNSPYPLNVDNPLLEYDVPLGNYLVNVHNLYYGIQGTLQPDQLDPEATVGYPAVLPGPGRAHFVGKVAPAEIVDGMNVATPPAGYATLGSFDDFGNLNAYYFGEINPQLTGGKTIGYLYLNDMVFIDPSGLSLTGAYAPENPNTSQNPRIAREALSTIYSEMMKWFNAAPPYNVDEKGNVRTPCEKIIIDCVGNFGGFLNVPLAIAEFMGADRILYNSYIVPKGSDKKLISTQHPDYPTVNDVAADQKCINSFLYVSLNKELYPGSVFEGTKCHPKEVIYLDDIFAYSSGDLGPNMFTGDTDDGYLGRYVQMNLVGCVDGREFGGGFLEPFPVNTNTALTLSDGTPVSPFGIGADFGTFYNAYGKSAISPYVQHNAIKPVRSPISGTSGGAALPISFEATVFQDFGLTPMTRAPLPGWTAGPPDFNDPSTWRYLYLEQGIEVAKKPVKFRTKHPKKRGTKPPKCHLAKCNRSNSSN